MAKNQNGKWGFFFKGRDNSESKNDDAFSPAEEFSDSSEELTISRNSEETPATDAIVPFDMNIPQEDTDSQQSTVPEPVPVSSLPLTPPEPAPVKKKPTFAYTSDPLQFLYNVWLDETDQDGISGDISDYMTHHAERPENDSLYNFDVNVKRFFMQARIVAKKRLNDYTAALRRAVSSDTEQPEYSAPAELISYITPDGMLLLVAVLPPIGKGLHIQASQLTDCIQTAGVRNGTSRAFLKKIIDTKSYFTIYPLAVGNPAIPGKDGTLIERFPRGSEVTYGETDTGNIDFTSRNFFKEIKKNEVICDILPPSKGTNGIDIRGKAILAKPGKVARIPQGKNTVISDDGKALIAATDGYISFRQGTFQVIQVLEIHGNVDFSVGNLKYHGGIVVHGDVLNGFEIQAEGDVVVHGVVEAAHITSGGNIIIHNGMNGNFEGELNAAGDVRSPFLENTLVSAGKDVYAGSIICCDVFCDGTIYANSRMGIIIGGTLTAMHAIKARIIGNKAGRKTELILGTLPHAIREKDGLEKYEKTVDDTMNLLEKNITYLKSIENLSDQKANVLKQLEDQYQLYLAQKESLQQRQEAILQQLDLVEEAVIECRTIYPITNITIRSVSTKITEIIKDARITLTENGDIEVTKLR
ncbi:MAG: DUF342 domain-containing protein [Lachnospiraceae bacterium]|nr:DUF342 domain-containing protein [Lachnospiraceae bacterium]